MKRITIISKRVFRFHHPNIDVMTLGAGAGAPKYEDAVFVTNGTGELQQAPDWINRNLGVRKKSAESVKLNHPDIDINAQNMLTWERGVKDGHLMEVQIRSGAEGAEPSDLEKQSAARQAEIANQVANSDGEPQDVMTVDELNAMNKTQLLEHAAVEHGLELPSGTTKVEIIEAIQKAQAGPGQTE